MPNLTSLIHRFMDIAEKSNHEYERVDWLLIVDCCNHHRPTTVHADPIFSENITILPSDEPPYAGLGLLTLHCVIARWGVDFTLEIDSVTGTPRGLLVDPKDPAGVDWAGVKAKRGKHYLDGTHLAPYGGIGIPHADSSFMRRLDDQFRSEKTRALDIDMRAHRRSWNQLLRSHREPLLDWGTTLLLTEDGKLRREVHEWIVREWLRLYWEPAVQAVIAEIEASLASGVDHSRSTMAALFLRCAGNAGIANSAKGWAKRWRHLSFGEQAHKYEMRKLEKRGERAAARAARRMKEAERIPVLFEAAWIAPVEG